MKEVPKHCQANLYPGELTTIVLLHALKGVGQRAFYRWLLRDYKPLFPNLPDRTRLFHALAAHQDWMQRFLAAPALLGVCDSYSVELLHPRREGRSNKQLGRKGKTNHHWVINQRWVIGAKIVPVLNSKALVVDWECDTATAYDARFHPLLEKYAEEMIVLCDSGFHSKDGDPLNCKICKRGQWNERMLIETLFSMLKNVCHFKQVRHRLWSHLKARFAYIKALYNILVQWHGEIRLSIAPFSL